MTPQESQLLQSFLDALVQVRGLAKDRDAEAQIARAVAQQPDAAYLLVQRALLQDQAMEAAQARIAELERKLAAPAPAPATNSFLSGGGWGRQATAPSGPAGAGSAADVSVTGRPLSPNPAAGLPGAQPGNQLAAARHAAPAARTMGGGFLPTLAATAAGVVGGAFLFQGIQHLLNSNADSNANTAAAAPTGDSSLLEGSYAADSYAGADANDQVDLADSSGADFGMDGDDYV